MDTLGTYLRQQRERAELSMETVAVRTKIRPSLLLDLEADKLDSMPSGVILRGFIKAYTDTVRCSSGRALEILEAQQGHADSVLTYMSPLSVDEEHVSGRFKVAHLVVLVFALLTMLGAYFMLSGPPAERATISSAPTVTDVTSGTTKSFSPRASPRP
jgi:cytoskeletal protein RodZ